MDYQKGGDRMSNVVYMFEWQRKQHLNTPLGKLITEYGNSQRAKIERRITENICMCFFRDAYGDSMCSGCPANEDE